MESKKLIVVKCWITSPIVKIWNYWTVPRHIENWNFIFDEWKCTTAENDVSENGRFTYHLSADHGNSMTDYSGIYTEIIVEKLIKQKLDDGRLTTIVFSGQGYETEIVVTFEADDNSSSEEQQNSWNAVLANFKAYSENPATIN